MTTLLHLPAGLVSFPPGCVGCGAVAAVPWEISRFRGFDAGQFAIGDRIRLPVRVCRPCRRRRRMVTAVGWLVGVPLSILPTVVAVEIVGPLEDPLRNWPALAWLAGMAIVLGWAALVLGYLRSHLPRLADHLALGVSIARWDRSAQMVGLAVSRPGLIEELRERAARLRRGDPPGG